MDIWTGILEAPELQVQELWTGSSLAGVGPPPTSGLFVQLNPVL